MMQCTLFTVQSEAQERMAVNAVTIVRPENATMPKYIGGERNSPLFMSSDR